MGGSLRATRPRPAGRSIGAAAIGAASLLLAACTASNASGLRPGGSTTGAHGTTGGTTGGTTPGTAPGHGTGPTHHPRPPAPAFTISPANGSTNVATDQIVTGSIPNGRIVHITVSSGGSPVPGWMGPDGRWHSTWALGVSQSYSVLATGVDAAGRPVTATSSFRTIAPTQTFETQIFEGYMLTYGVGMPIELDFTQPITNKAAVERALQITTSKPVVGAWYWNGDQQVDFRPRGYWPSGTRVSFVGHLDGVEGAPGVFGYHTLTQTFLIGPPLIVVASTATHYMTVYYKSKRLYYWPISSGRPGDDTPDGTYLTINKANPQHMVGPGYNLQVPWSVRITWSGDFLHAAPWSVGVQGVANVSHGCINMHPEDAAIYYNLAIPGEPVTVIGSPRAGKWGNGWTEWFLSWDRLVAGSALHEAVMAGPNGSVFVTPASLPPSHATAPLQTSPPNNSAPTV